jgi:hypothetical protein
VCLCTGRQEKTTAVVLLMLQWWQQPSCDDVDSNRHD